MRQKDAQLYTLWDTVRKNFHCSFFLVVVTMENKIQNKQ